jgi:predicted dehydrogenase
MSSVSRGCFKPFILSADMRRIAVIGCGHWGPNHIRNFESLPGSEVTMIVDADSVRLRRMVEFFPTIASETDYRRALQNPEIDAVVVATPTRTHYRIVHDALSAGKHVLCEKPLCRTVPEGRDLVKLAEQIGLVLMVGHVFLFNAGVLKLKQLIDDGGCGKLQYLAATRTNLGPIRSDVNAAYDLASHDISILNWLLRDVPESVSATGAVFLQPKVEDVAFISLKYPDGVFGNIHVSWLNPKKVRQMTVVGTQKMVTWDDLDLNTPIAIYDKGASALPMQSDYGEFLHVSMWDGDVQLPKVLMEEPLKAQDRYFLTCVEQQKIDRSDGKFGLGVVGVLAAIEASLAAHGAPMQVQV